MQSIGFSAKVYFVGTALITAAALVEGSIPAALVISGGSLIVYGFIRALGDHI